MSDAESPPRADNVLCILDDAPILGGAERFALRLAQEVLQSKLYGSIVVACPGESALAEAAHREGLQVASVSFPDPRVSALARLPSALIALRRLIRRVKPTTVVGNTARSQFYVAIAMAGQRGKPSLVHVVHEQDSAARRMLRIMYARTGRLEVVGANATRTYRDRIPGVEIHQINNFLTAAEFGRLRSVRRRWLSVPGGRVLGVLGRMVPEKGFVELVEELAAAGTDAWGELRIAAFSEHPSYEQRLRTTVARLDLGDRIHLVGPAPDAASFLSDIDVLVVPSTGNEGQPTVILEALAAGRPVIARRPLYSEDFDQLEVFPYSNASDLRRVLLTMREPTGPSPLLRHRFGAGQAVSAIAPAPIALR
jgi:glycosyltransferase involved in cell wall biosynthesis